MLSLNMFRNAMTKANRNLLYYKYNMSLDTDM